MFTRQNPRREFLKAMGWGLASVMVPGCAGRGTAKRILPEHPNIVYILADDLGYGDVTCLNKDSKIPTPNMDRIAREGMIFTDAHSGSGVCTPTRYGVLTGRYCWRSRLKRGVLGGYSWHLIKPTRLTVASLLKQHGYKTACVGKWHLGLDWATKVPIDFEDRIKPKADIRNVDYTKPIKNGPVSLGFDYFYGISASLDMPPYIYIHNDCYVGLPTTQKAFHRKGPAHKDFEAEDVLPTITRKAVEYIDEYASSPGRQPFFLYFSLTSPHTPIVPSAQFRGKSGINDYADFVMQTDWTVGKVLESLERNGLVDNTLVIMTSDNGYAPYADLETLQKHGHEPSYHFRGYKADIYEGGHRIPFFVRWPRNVGAGSIFTDTICLTDLMATVADIVGVRLPDNAAEDSVSILPALLGKAAGPLREATVHHSVNGSFSIRQGCWKLELCPGSGGWSYPKPGRDDMTGLPSVQLYDLSEDIGEKRNVQDKHPDIVRRLTKLLERYVSEGRSTPGLPQKNEDRTNIRK